ncbi:bifunctional UDP-sugar hydrolase/5'-nucleotidase [Rhodosalinus sp. 5P4]|uniref:bifunctional metallophosphatase/5'-nucleotidase n=1 Tax=Rhodosalinus sp. 5P4 TaxID=3239196 RepID=UPI003526B7DE
MLPRFFCGAAALALCAGAAVADDMLHILHVNDFHSRIEPINRFDSTCAPEDNAAGECFGGAARLAAAIEAKRAEIGDAPLLVLDAGDQYQGSLFYTTYKGRVAAEMMERIGFDAMAVGNHEFDDGPEGLSVLLDNVSFPVVSGNLDLSRSNLLKGRVGGPVVLEAGGQRIGIVSALATDTAETASPGPGVIFQDEIESLRAQVEALEAEGVDRIVALTHVGLPKDREIAGAVPGIDVILGGHSHTLMSNTTEGALAYPQLENGVPIAQAYAYGKYLGHLVVTFDAAGQVVSAEGDTLLLDASVPEDAAIAARVAEFAQPLEEIKARVVAETAAAIDGDRSSCRAGECEMGNLVADAMLARVRDQGIQIAIQNGGGLRASIDAGPVTMGEVLTVLPFQNTLATFQLGGADVLTALENGVSQIEEGAGRFPQVAGLRYAFDPAAPPGARVSDVQVMVDGAWQPLDPEATYGVVSNNYMRGGGDGYSVFASEAMNAYDYGPGLEEVVADYLARNGPYTPFTEGRITRK